MAASSSVSKMMIKWAKMNGVETLNIVHKEEHEVDLKNNYGANFFFNSESSTFWDEVKKAIETT